MTFFESNAVISESEINRIESGLGRILVAPGAPNQILKDMELLFLSVKALRSKCIEQEKTIAERDEEFSLLCKEQDASEKEIERLKKESEENRRLMEWYYEKWCIRLGTEHTKAEKEIERLKSELKEHEVECLPRNCVCVFLPTAEDPVIECTYHRKVRAELAAERAKPKAEVDD